MICCSVPGCLEPASKASGIADLCTEHWTGFVASQDAVTQRETILEEIQACDDIESIKEVLSTIVRTITFSKS